MSTKKKWLLIIGIVLCIALFPAASLLPYTGIIQIILIAAMAYMLSFFIRRKR